MRVLYHPYSCAPLAYDSPMKKPQAILFDLDGTLIDSVIQFTAILNELLIEAAKPEIAIEQVRPWVTGGALEMVQSAFGTELTPNKVDFLKNAFLLRYDRLLNTTLPCYFPDVESVLRQVNAQGVRIGIVTNKHRCFAERVLRQVSFKESLACVIYGDTLSTPKPSPEPLYLACQQLKLAPEQAWFVGDGLVDMQAANAAGCVSILARYGYVSSAWQSWSSCYVLNQLTDLLALIKVAECG